jgi:hypothetical protein
MADEANYTEVQQVWVGFVRSLGGLLAPQPEDRPLDQYLHLRERVLTLVQAPEFLSDLHKAWGPASAGAAPRLDPRISAALLAELRAFPLAVEVARTTEAEPGEKRGFWRRLLGRAGTTVDSVRDLADLTPFGKAVLTLTKELIDLFKA